LVFVKTYYVYILSNSTGVLYTGVTNDLERRLAEHRTKQTDGFTKKYGVNRLVYFGEFAGPNEAIKAEKQVKGMPRKKRVELIRQINPTFKDLSEDWDLAESRL
jgi:putative endonuclease